MSHAFHRYCVTLLVLTLSATFAGFTSEHGTGTHVSKSTSTVKAAKSEHDYHGSAPKPGELGGPFKLTDHTGRVVTDKTFHGKWTLMYFGYVRCEEACPLALTNVGEVMDALGDAGDKIEPVFVDFDFKRTKQRELADHVRAIHPRLVGLRGTRRQIFLISRAFKVRKEHSVVAYKPKDYKADARYTSVLHKSGHKHGRGHRIRHTTRIYLLAPDGTVADYFYHTIEPAKLASELKRRME
ncbi:MAG: SCO family protein [Hyphomicrobiaceae bacterium]